jgi:hypothetical protein
MKILQFNVGGQKSALFILKEQLFCIVLNETLSVLKEYIIKRHYETKHKSQLSGIKDQLRRGKIPQLQNRLAQHYRLFKCPGLQSDTAVRADYVVSEILAKIH